MARNIQKTLDDLARQFGSDIIAKLGAEPVPVEIIPTGIISVDRALGIGGFPKGRITVMYGPESGGKTTLSLWAVGCVLNEGGTAVYLDVEQGGSEQYVYDCIRAAGVEDVATAVEEGRLIVSRPETAEAVTAVSKALIPFADILVIDSISSMATSSEQETEPGKYPIGMAARFLTAELKKIQPVLGASQCAMIAISQVRVKFSGWGGAIEGTTEPNALRHMASIRLRISKKGGPVTEPGTGKMLGQEVKITVKKNKLGVPGRTAEFMILFGQGVDIGADALDTAVKAGVVRKAGGWYSYPESGEPEWKIQGRIPAAQYLRDHSEAMEVIRAAILKTEMEDEYDDSPEEGVLEE